MREYSWNVFAVTGDIEAYLLYKEFSKIEQQQPTACSENSEGSENEDLELGTQV